MTPLVHPRGRVQALTSAALARPLAPVAAPPRRWLLVDVALQRVLLMHGAEPASEWPVSTARAGIGGADGSLRTPPGWHRVHARIGAGAVAGAVFESREPTGAVWRGEPREDDLILTRVLTLEGLEDGVNRGPGHDSLERYIYLHGTNHEAALGRPDSHGCVRLSNRAITEVFDQVAEGDLVAVIGDAAAPDAAPATGANPAAEPEIPDPAGPGRFHYAGLGGSGMSALAQFQVMTGGSASGSDRAFDRGERAEARAQLEALGVRVHPQDGSGVEGAAALVVSTAVEEQVPDVAAARAASVPVVHRSRMLAHFVAGHRTIAVGGTSGKSTVVAMIFEILRGAGRDPGVITGGDLVTLEREGYWGNAWAGDSDLLVVEADESDGSLVRYEPAVGVILNLEKDHKEVHETAAMFATFTRRTRAALVVGDAANLAEFAGEARARGLAVSVAGFGPAADVPAGNLELLPDASVFTVRGTRFRLPVPGRHNVENALAAIAACSVLGVPLAVMVEPLARFAGVGRRFQSLGVAGGVEVVDDFAHNPAKLRAALVTAQRRAARVLAVFQPHGFGPTRFLRAELVSAIAESLRPADRAWLLEIFYAGGTAVRDLSSADLVADLVARDAPAEFAPSRDGLVTRLMAEARPGDLVLVMGARDPSLTTLARQVLAGIEQAGTRGAGPGATG
jgi:UDP-N-acetylmuramate-alanine ligase